MPRPAAQQPALSDATFDSEDRDLFAVDDPRLRADALKHSLLPRLHVVLRACLDRVATVYDVDPLEHSRLARYPNFREQREAELAHLYTSAFSGVGGSFRRVGWPGFARARGGGVVQIVPFRFGLSLTPDGLSVLLENGWVTGLTPESYDKLFDFHLEHEALVQALAHQGCFVPALFYSEGDEPVAPFREQYARMRDVGAINNHWETVSRGYSVDTPRLDDVVASFVAFYPIYDSYVRIALGERPRLADLIQRYNRALRAVHDADNQQPGGRLTVPPSSEVDVRAVRERAEERIPVLPSWRWQVFQRDGWRCVACGQDASAGVVLHVDHIVPRSLGGRDELANYQTLCHVCNLGKSNRDATDLRPGHHRAPSTSRA